MTAGTNGAHHAFIPNADNEVGPSERMTNMIVLAQAKALRKLSPENFRGRTPAYAQASGIAIRRPGKKRTARMNLLACLRIRS